MRLSLFVTFLCAFLPLATAVDFRVLVKFSPKHYHSGKAFCKAWEAACHKYHPKDHSLVFASTSCRPGDFKGKHTDDEALVTCVFEESVADGVIKELHIQHA